MRKILFASMALAAFSAVAAQAAQDTDTMAVTATAVPECTVTAGALGFGNYTGSANVDSSATIDVACGAVEPSSSVYVTFDLGLNPDATQRQMANGSSRL
jgi:spore coat protein U-like protein